MYRELALKELRETWWLGAAAFLFLATGVWDWMGLTVDVARMRITSMAELSSSYRHRIPFLHGDVQQFVMMGGGLLAIGLGLWQTMGESFRGTWKFLLHRPLPREAVILTKVAIGLFVLLVATGLPLVIYAWWAATPGTHASPFEWWMTGPAWLMWAACTPLYLAALLCGLREARWYGSQFLPIVPFLFLPLGAIESSWLSWAVWAAIAISDVVLLAAILFAAGEREFS